MADDVAKLGSSPVHYLSFAQNTHDSCMTLGSGDEVLAHLEFERIVGRKRFCVNDVSTVLAAANILLTQHAVHDDLTLILCEHNAQTLNDDAEEALIRSLPVVASERVEHFDAHAAFAGLAGVDRAVVVVADGGGDRLVPFGTANVDLFNYSNGAASRSGSLFPEPGSGIDGRAWTAAAYRMFADLHAAGKVMGLAAHGKNPDRHLDRLRAFIRRSLQWGYDDAGLEEVAALIDFGDFSDMADWAAGLQLIHTELLFDALEPHCEQAESLVLAGGCALNVVTNAALANRLSVETCSVPACPGDEGQSLGALLAVFQDRGAPIRLGQYPFLGLGSEENLISASQYRDAARLLARGQTLAVHTGRPEIGPRALGHRSFLASPSVANRDRVSIELKGREPFRPVAPIVPLTTSSQWFDIDRPSPHMSFAATATDLARTAAPGVVHVDGTSRVQTVSPASNSHLMPLFEALDAIGEPPLLINTSLNTAGYPIAQSADDTLRIFLRTSLDAALVDGVLYRRT